MLVYVGKIGLIFDISRYLQAEFTYVPEHITAGAYLLSLQIAPIELDASPTRPLLFAISNIKLE